MPYLVVGGKPTGDWAVTRKTANYQSNGPVTDIKSDAFRCYQLAPGNEGATIVNVTAGSTIASGARASFSHPGNFGAWLSKVPAGKTALEWNGDGASWVKIYNDEPVITAGGITWPSQSECQPICSLLLLSNMPSERGRRRPGGLEQCHKEQCSPFLGAPPPDPRSSLRSSPPLESEHHVSVLR